MQDDTNANYKKEIFTVPNILVYIRIILTPIFVICYLNSSSQNDYLISFVILAAAFLTDFFDGKIARKFNCITDLGKTIDPIADKLCQFSVALCLMLKIPEMIAIVVLLFLKEISMGIMGLVLLGNGGKVFGAKWYGKLCTAFIDCTMLLFLISPFTFELPAILKYCLIYGCIALLIFTSIMYTRLFSEKIKKL